MQGEFPCSKCGDRERGREGERDGKRETDREIKCESDEGKQGEEGG